MIFLSFNDKNNKKIMKQLWRSGTMSDCKFEGYKFDFHLIIASMSSYTKRGVKLVHPERKYYLIEK